MATRQLVRRMIMVVNCTVLGIVLDNLDIEAYKKVLIALTLFPIFVLCWNDRWPEDKTGSLRRKKFILFTK